MGGTNLLGPHIFHFTLETSTFVSSRFLAPPKIVWPREKFVMCIIYFFHTHELRIFYLIRDFLWSQPSIRLHSICIAIKLLASWILEKTIDSS